MRLRPQQHFKRHSLFWFRRWRRLWRFRPEETIHGALGNSSNLFCDLAVREAISAKRGGSLFLFVSHRTLNQNGRLLDFWHAFWPWVTLPRGHVCAKVALISAGTREVIPAARVREVRPSRPVLPPQARPAGAAF
jgi:hypothetical protein